MSYAQIQASLGAIDADAKALSDALAARTAELVAAQADSTTKASEIAALKAEIVTLKARIAELTAPPAQGKTLFTTQVPATNNVSDGSGTAGDYELGMRFTVAASGVIQAIRYFKASSETGTHTGRIWNAATGAQLASVVFANETASGWQEQALPTPLPVAAGVTYVVSVNATRFYVVTAAAFGTPLVANGITAPAGAGVYNATPGQLPTTAWNNSNYFRDIVFLQTGAVTPPPVAPSPVTPPPITPPPVTPPPTTSILNLPRVPWWGGPAYYAKFPKAVAAGWTDPSFFPLSVFFGKPTHAARLKAAGINVYQGAEKDGSPISSITDLGISVIAQREWTLADVGSNPRVVGWHISDEAEMTFQPGFPDGEYGSLEAQKSYAAQVRAYNDGRLVQANFGNGVLGSFWSPNTMDDHLAVVDLSAVDKYAYTSPHVQYLFTQSDFWPKGVNPSCSYAYGWQQDRMILLGSTLNGQPVAQQKPNWPFVETAMPFLTESGARVIGLEEIEGAVWNSIIHGAAGISYFQHDNSGTGGTYSIIENTPARTAKITAINAQVARLAPVLNTQSYAWNFGAGLDTMLKAYSNSAYIFAMIAGGSAPGSRVFTLPAGVSGTSVEVVDENRSIAIVGGKFTDNFAAEHEHHIYKIAI